MRNKPCSFLVPLPGNSVPNRIFFDFKGDLDETSGFGRFGNTVTRGKPLESRLCLVGKTDIYS